MKYRYLLSALSIAIIAVVYLHYFATDKDYRKFEQFEQNSTDRFENKVEYKLEVAGCQNPEYYTETKEDKEAVCFDCSSYDMCMEYDDFSKTPYNKVKEFENNGVYFKEEIDQEKRHAIGSDNLTRKLNCGCKDRRCECDKQITAVRLNNGYVYTYEGSEVIGEGRGDRSVLAAYRIDERLGGGQCSTTTKQIKCQNFNAEKVKFDNKTYAKPRYP